MTPAVMTMLFFHAFGIHRFVHHACNLAVSAQRQPADAVFGFPDFEAQQFEASGIEEEIELVHADAENPGGQVMA